MTGAESRESGTRQRGLPFQTTRLQLIIDSKVLALGLRERWKGGAQTSIFDAEGGVVATEWDGRLQKVDMTKMQIKTHGMNFYAFHRHCHGK